MLQPKWKVDVAKIVQWSVAQCIFQVATSIVDQRSARNTYSQFSIGNFSHSNRRSVDSNDHIHESCTLRHANIDQEKEFSAASRIQHNSDTANFSHVELISFNSNKSFITHSVINLTPKNRGTIVILTMLKRLLHFGLDNLDLLYKNFNNKFHEDIWIIHEGDINTTMQQYIGRGRREVRFLEVTLAPRGQHDFYWPGTIRPNIYLENISTDIFGEWKLVCSINLYHYYIVHMI